MPNISKTGGAKSFAKSGGTMLAASVQYDPDNWLVSMFRALKSYIETQAPGVYNIIGSFPSDNDLLQSMPFRKTIIHFEIDDINNTGLGFGDDVVQEIYDPQGKLVTGFQAIRHEVNFDVGIWASQSSGGVTARLNAYQTLTELFQGPMAFQSLRNNAGMELVSFNGGVFMVEQIKDLDVWRVASMTLVLRVFSRHTLAPNESIEDLIPYSDLTIDQTVVVEI